MTSGYIYQQELGLNQNKRGGKEKRYEKECDQNYYSCCAGSIFGRMRQCFHSRIYQQCICGK